MFAATKKGNTLELLVYDDIGEGWFGGVTSKDVIKELKADSDDINVRINSPGGDIFEGFAIFNALARDERQVTVDIDSVAASAASVIAMAGDEIRIAPNAMVMIHNAWTWSMGDSRELRRVAELLDQIGDNIAQTYVDRSSLSASEVREAMDAETWYTADEAVAAGLADSVSESELAVAAAVFDPKRVRNTPERFKAAKPPESKKSPVWDAEANRRRLALARAGG